MEHTPSNATTHSPTRSTPASSSPSTTVTTPEQSPGADEDIWDDASSFHALEAANDFAGSNWGTDSDDERGAATGLPSAAPHGTGMVARSAILSDVPSVRRQHMTEGYREGLAVGKASVMQAGFDAGYPFGVEMGLRAGTMLGVLEGLIAGVRRRKAASSSTTTTTTTSGRGNVDDDDQASIEEDVAFLRDLYERAKRELSITELMRGIDDEKIDRLGQVDANEAQQQQQGLPLEIETVIARWEEIVLTGMPSNPGRDVRVNSND